MPPRKKKKACNKTNKSNKLPLPLPQQFFYIYPPGSGKLVQGRNENFQRSIDEQRIWKSFDKKMKEIRSQRALEVSESRQAKIKENAETKKFWDNAALELEKATNSREKKGVNKKNTTDKGEASDPIPGCSKKSSNQGPRYNLRSRDPVKLINSYKEPEIPSFPSSDDESDSD